MSREKILVCANAVWTGLGLVIRIKYLLPRKSESSLIISQTKALVFADIGDISEEEEL